MVSALSIMICLIISNKNNSHCIIGAKIVCCNTRDWNLLDYVLEIYMCHSLGLNFFSRILWFSSIQSLSRVRLFATPWIAARLASLSITNSRSSLRLTSIESMMPPSHLILGRPLLLLPPISPSIRVFSKRILEWVAISFSRGSSQSRNWTQVSCIAGIFFTNWAMREIFQTSCGTA